ncbi:hypothetical protein [Enterococcus faecium]|uniref:hypothetical protein n=1 Tax=Enterococcus faecium TaxID=1352 RepID=UPI003CC72261
MFKPLIDSYSAVLKKFKGKDMSCGYKALRVKEDIQTERIYNDSLKARALSFFQNGSVLTDKTLATSPQGQLGNWMG